METPNPPSPRATKNLLVPILVLVSLNLVLLGVVLYSRYQKGAAPQPPAGVESTVAQAFQTQVTQTPTQNIITRTTMPTLAPNTPPQEGLRQQGVIILAMEDGNFTHLFAYHPQFLPLTRLTNNPWDDIDPAISPDGSRVAFSSRRNGYWDIYWMDLATSAITRVTDSPEYDGHPGWSPDGQWLVYETYQGDNLELFLLNLADPKQAPIQLTNDPAADHSPAWSPRGREIAFVSNRTGDDDIWIARLEQVDDRFVNLSESPSTNDEIPSWDSTGQYLAYAAHTSQGSAIIVWGSQQSTQSRLRIGDGDRVVWSPASDALLTEVRLPNQTSLIEYSLPSGELGMPLTPFTGALHGFDWKAGPVADLLVPRLNPANQATSASLWQPALTLFPIQPSGRFGVVQLDGVAAPNPMLHDRVDEAFSALRYEVGREAGWDFLASLENAYIPLTEPPLPSMETDWLYTGRAFNVNPLPLQAGWMVITREDIAGQTYWRIYLKARYQDGSQGLPLSSPPWNLDARYTRDPLIFEQGGQLAPIPAGYWIDFTSLAQRYGWERLPALSNWRAFYSATRFNQYVITEGLDWQTAMAQLYPPEAMATSTMIPTRTPSPSPTAEDYISPTPSQIPTLTTIPTRRPTWTPMPGQ